VKGNIAETLVEVADKYGDRTGLVEAKTGNSLTFSRLHRYTDGLAFYLKDNGIGTGDRVMLMVPPSADFICLTFALFKIGAPVILIDPGMGYRNLLRSIAGVKPKVFIGIPKAHLFRRLFPKPFATVTNSFCSGYSCGLFGPDIRKKAGDGQKNFPVFNPSAKDLAAIIFTTGSTGPPKGVRYEHSIFATQLDMIRDYYRITPEDVDQPAFPLFALFSAALGACSVIPDMNPAQPAKVDPEKFIRSLKRYKVTYSFGSPAIWNVVSRYCIDKGITIDSLKQVLMAGAPISGELIARVSSILPDGAKIHTPYGATESLPIVSMEGKEILDSTWDLTRIGKGTCVGRPLPGIEIKIISISDEVIEVFDKGIELPTGEIGEIIVRGGVVTRAYENNLRETKVAKIKDNETFWHRMGDTGYLDVQGRLWFCGRRAHRVKSRTGVLFTTPCEAIINTHPDVFRSALVGVADAEYPGYQLPVLIIEKKRECKKKLAEILTEIKEIAAENSLTKDIKYFLFHNGFPVDIRHNAKIFREKLAAWAEAEINKT
jgi:olefin beta-lactone synthetase